MLVTAITGLSSFEFSSEPMPVPHRVSDVKVTIPHEQPIDPIQPATQKGRAPASINSEMATSSLQKNFFCNHSYDRKQNVAQVSHNMVMLNFKLCKDSKKIGKVSLVNETNGFKAQIFQPNLNSYKTDYIQLSEGSNNIMIEVVLKDGQISRESLVILTGS